MTRSRTWRIALLAVAVVSLGACRTEHVVRGEVFLRAPDGTARKLALVKVRAYDEATVRRVAAAQRASRERDAVDRVLLALPLDVPTATTNADGGYALALPTTGRVAIQAMAGGGTQRIITWLLWHDPAHDSTRVDLTSENHMLRSAGEEVAHDIERWAGASVAVRR